MSDQHSERPVILVVDDKRNMLRLMSKVLASEAEVLTAEGGAAALALIEDRSVDVVLCDLKMPDMTGLEVLEACKRRSPTTEFVLMTAYASVGTAVEALKLGAFDYLTKPFDPEAARDLVLRALARARAAQGAAPDPEVLPGVIARSAVMRDLAELVQRVADSEATVLLLGETGTGKERVARAIHQLSHRASGPYVALNCAAVPPDLLESELFGHARGAFTGAVADRAGLLEAAGGGSLLLDEIGDLRLSLQAKLTRALEERAIRRVGEGHERRIDARLIAATHRDLEAMVASGAFREDLWYRLNVALVRIPPLRQRREDVALLARHFLGRFAEQSRTRPVEGFSAPALEALVGYDWPGNVRQLRSAVERACVVARTAQISIADLPPEVLPGARSAQGSAHEDCTWAEALDRGRAEVGRRYLEAVMRRFEGRVAEAAAHAGVERESFYRLLRKHGVEAADYRR